VAADVLAVRGEGAGRPSFGRNVLARP